MSYVKNMYLFFNTLRFLPHILLFIFSLDREKIEKDVERWSKRFYDASFEGKNKMIKSLIWLLSFKKEYRNVYLHRIRKQFPLLFHICNFISPRLDSLYIPTPLIGGGLFIEHGFSTTIAAEKIGENCSVYQQVTIGYSDDGKAPIIGNNVIIGANAVVVKDVPSNCTVVGIPAYIVRRDGQKLVENL